MKDTDLAYTAGVIDGEGSICANNQRHLMITVHQKHPEILNWLQERFGGDIRPNQSRGVFTDDPSGQRWSLDKIDEQKRFLTTILPYLVLKKAQAELALGLLETAPGRGRGHEKSIRLQFLQDKIIAALSDLNRR